MRFAADTLGIPNSAFVILRDLIHERTGMFFDNGKRDLLANKLAPRVVERGLPSFLDYYYLLKYDRDADDEWRHVMDALSVPETYFWREMDAVHALVDVLVPQWVAEHPGATLRIWSAACATGEEPLTIAMALHEAGWFERAPIAISGSDASARAIASAQRGVYRERSFRALPNALRERYFSPTPEGWRIAPELHTRIGWSIANLHADEELAQSATASFIFCRNVFIYFSSESIRTTARSFAAHAPSPAYLFLGVSESLMRLTEDWVLQEIGNAFVYVK
jgi:chemotaxis protein methyltransferase CheR